jgi:hypothetical protein
MPEVDAPLDAGADGPSDADGIVCTVCLEIHGPDVNYCPQCGAPANSLIAFNPFDQTLIEGFAFRRAVDGPASGIILTGMWLLFGPSVLEFACAVFGAGGGDLPGSAGGAPWMGGSVIISAPILYRATANYFAKRRSRKTGAAEQAD